MKRSLQPNPHYLIVEVTHPDASELVQMNNWLMETFPEYAPPRFDMLLNRLRRPDGRHQIQIFVRQVAGQVAGLAQVLYREWDHRLIADLDLLGVLKPYRRYGLGSALVSYCIEAAKEMARQYQLPPLGLVSLADPGYNPILRLHSRLGGQIRSDYRHPEGDCIIWYPFTREADSLPSTALAAQLDEFAGLLS